MIKMHNTFIFLFCLLCSKATMANYVWTPVDESKSFNPKLIDVDREPDTWMDLGSLNIGTASTLDSGISPCHPSSFICTAGEIDLGYNGKAGYILNLIRKTDASATDEAGNRYMITIAFPDKAPAVGVFEKNNAGGQTWNNVAGLDNGLSSPSDGRDVATATSNAQGYCGRVSGCSYRIGSYIHTDSGMPHVYVKIPKNLSAKKISFSNAEVLELALHISNKSSVTVSPVSAKLFLSGTISFPQRCYIKADKKSFEFGTVYSNAGNGALKNMSASITTDCYYAPNNTQQYLKMETVSGGTLNNSSLLYQIASDSALGIVFNINSNPQCNSTTDNKNVFNKEYLIRSITYQPRQTATDTVNFALCKYGVPSVTGQKTVVLKLTSRWVVN